MKGEREKEREGGEGREREVKGEIERVVKGEREKEREGGEGKDRGW